jgi:putative ABC transport system permease protein
MFRNWRLSLACIVLVSVPVGMTLALRVLLAGMQAEYSRLSIGLLVVQKSDSMGELYGSRLSPETGDLLREMGYASPIPSIQEMAGTSVSDAVLIRGVDLAEYRGLDSLEVLSGDALASGSPPRTAMIGYRLANYRELAPGDRLNLRGRPFTVVGIFETGNYLDNQAWISLEDAQTLFNYGEDVSVYVIPDGGRLNAGDTLPGGLVVAQRGEMAQHLGEEFLSVVHFLEWVVKIQAVGMAAMLANILWRLAWLRRRELSVLRSLGFGRWSIGVYLLAQAGATVILGGLLGALAAGTVGTRLIQMVAGFGLQAQLGPSALLAGVLLGLGVLMIGVVVPVVWFNQMNLALLLRSE